MHYSGSLYELVLSLTKTEKRYFKLFARLNKEESNLIRIFDAISIQNLATDNEVKEYFTKQPFVRHFDVYKVHLKEIILNSMRNFHQNRSKQNVLQNNLEDVRFFFMKGLFKQCNKLIKSAKNLAQETGNFTILLDLLEVEGKIPEGKETYQNTNIKLHKLFEEQNFALNNLMLEIQVGFKITTADLLIKKFETKESEIDYFELVKTVEEINKFKTDESPALQRKVYQSKAEFHRVLHQYTEAKKYIELLIVSYESSSITLRENVENYIKALANRISLCIQLNQFEDGLQWNEALKNVPLLLDKKQKRDNKLLALVDGYYIQNKLKIYLFCGEMEKVLPCVVETELLLSRKNSAIPEEMQTELITLKVYYYFMLQDLQKIETLLEFNKVTITNIKNREQAINLAMLQYLLALIKGNPNELRNTFRSLYHLLLTGKGFSQFEHICLAFIRKSGSIESSSISKRKLENVLLKELYKLETGPFWENRSIRFDLISWLEGRQKELPLFQILKEKHPI